MQHLRQAPAMEKQIQVGGIKRRQLVIGDAAEAGVLGVQGVERTRESPCGAQATRKPLIIQTEIRFGFILFNPLIALFQIILTT